MKQFGRLSLNDPKLMIIKVDVRLFIFKGLIIKYVQID